MGLGPRQGKTVASEMANDVGSVQDDGLDVEPRSGL